MYILEVLYQQYTNALWSFSNLCNSIRYLPVPRMRAALPPPSLLGKFLVHGPALSGPGEPVYTRPATMLPRRIAADSNSDLLRGLVHLGVAFLAQNAVPLHLHAW